MLLNPLSWRQRLVCLSLLGMMLAACGRAPTAPPTAAVPGATAGPASTTPASSVSPAIQTAEPDNTLYLPFVGLAATPTQPPPATEAPTNHPLPTTSPAPLWPEPIGTLTASKLGLHSLGTGDPYIMELIRRAKPRVVKSVGDFGWLKEVEEVSPEIVTIGRHLGEEGEWVNNIDPALAAQAYIDKHLNDYQLNSFVDYWEGWNEFVPVDTASMQWFARFEAERACQMQARGFRAVVGGFPVGVPEYNLMVEFLPALEAAQRCGGLFHLHEYQSPTFECGIQPPGVPGIIPGAPALSLPAGTLALRYRFWYEGYLKPRGLGDVPLVISEMNIDGVKPNPACDDPGGGGWKAYRDWWVRHGYGPDGDKAYVNVLAWYDAQLRQDAYVLGATIFTVSASDPSNFWHHFDIHDALPALAFYLTQQR